MGAENLLLVGSGTLFALLGASLVRRELRPRLLSLPTGTAENFPTPAPSTAAAPEAATAAAPTGPVRLADNPITLEAGRRYLASVTVSGPLSILATIARVRAQAEQLGFANVVVSESPPPGRPPLPPGDYYVEVTYAGPPRAIARSQGGGRVQVTDAWRLA